jgi:hypothetical protein
LQAIAEPSIGYNGVRASCAVALINNKASLRHIYIPMGTAQSVQAYDQIQPLLVPNNTRPLDVATANTFNAAMSDFHSCSSSSSVQFKAR